MARRMPRKPKVEPRTAAELKSATGRLHQARGAAMRDLKMLQEMHGSRPGKGKAKPAPARPGGIRMGD